MFQTLLASFIFLAAPRPSSYDPTETPEAMRARYASIADDVIAVTAAAEPLRGWTREGTALALLAIAHHESGFAGDVDRGQCKATAAGRCDGGLSVCLLQLHSRNPRERAVWAGDRRACLREGLRRARNARWGCSVEWQAYASGRCDGGAQTGRELAEYVGRWHARGAAAGVVTAAPW